MWAHHYVAEKVRELDEERLARMPRVDALNCGSSRVPVLGWLASATGRSLRRAGEGLESWASVSTAIEEPVASMAEVNGYVRFPRRQQPTQGRATHRSKRVETSTQSERSMRRRT